MSYNSKIQKNFSFKVVGKMNNRYKRLFEDDGKEGDLWPTFTDMLATILLVVLLFQVTTIIDLENEKVKAQDAATKSEQLQNEIDQINGRRSDIALKLKNAFEQNGIVVDVDNKTGAIRFSESILFESDSDKLVSQFKKQLDQIMPIYFEVLTPFIDGGEISEIVIEGHTDDVLDYNYNLALSQRRALNVSLYIVNNVVAAEKAEAIRSIMTANGRSYSDLKYKDVEKTQVDRSKSRRVEIKYRIANHIVDTE